MEKRVLCFILVFVLAFSGFVSSADWYVSDFFVGYSVVSTTLEPKLSDISVSSEAKKIAEKEGESDNDELLELIEMKLEREISGPRYTKISVNKNVIDIENIKIDGIGVKYVKLFDEEGSNLVLRGPSGNLVGKIETKYSKENYNFQVEEPKVGFYEISVEKSNKEKVFDYVLVEPSYDLDEYKIKQNILNIITEDGESYDLVGKDVSDLNQLYSALSKKQFLKDSISNTDKISLVLGFDKVSKGLFKNLGKNIVKTGDIQLSPLKLRNKKEIRLASIKTSPSIEDKYYNAKFEIFYPQDEDELETLDIIVDSNGPRFKLGLNSLIL